MKFRITKQSAFGSSVSNYIYYVEQEIDGVWGCSEAAFSIEEAECKLHKAIEKYKFKIQRVEVLKEVEV